MCIRDRSWDSPLIPTCRLARLLPTKPSSFDSAVKWSRSSTSAVAANSAASCGWPVAPALSANRVYLAYANASACIAACRFAFVVGCSSCAAWAAPPEESTSAATVAPSTALHLRISTLPASDRRLSAPIPGLHPPSAPGQRPWALGCGEFDTDWERVPEAEGLAGPVAGAAGRGRGRSPTRARSWPPSPPKPSSRTVTNIRGYFVMTAAEQLPTTTNAGVPVASDVH